MKTILLISIFVLAAWPAPAQETKSLKCDIGEMMTTDGQTYHKKLGSGIPMRDIKSVRCICDGKISYVDPQVTPTSFTFETMLTTGIEAGHPYKSTIPGAGFSLGTILTDGRPDKLASLRYIDSHLPRNRSPIFKLLSVELPADSSVFPSFDLTNTGEFEKPVDQP